ncbi:unannotated protein [freshwater metagenome]|uniref:Unannotated protein n=1 Tax=freshwater metagenome TaxID=449393 RepID=A0A6J6ZAF1_9ZZZZ
MQEPHHRDDLAGGDDGTDQTAGELPVLCTGDDKFHRQDHRPPAQAVEQQERNTHRNCRVPGGLSVVALNECNDQTDREIEESPARHRDANG